MNQLHLLADYINLSLLERQRAPVHDPAAEAQIASALARLRDGLAALAQDAPDPAGDDGAALATMQSQLRALDAQFESLTRPSDSAPSSSPGPAVAGVRKSLLRHSAAPAAGPLSPSGAGKTVRFHDMNAAAASSAGGVDRYRDDPEDDGAGATAAENQQLYAYHATVLASQDAQLDALGETIGRQRHLSIQIGDELDDHLTMLDRVDAAADRNLSRLDRGARQLSRLARGASESKEMLIILVLIVVLILLIAILK